METGSKEAGLVMVYKIPTKRRVLYTTTYPVKTHQEARCNYYLVFEPKQKRDVITSLFYSAIVFATRRLVMFITMSCSATHTVIALASPYSNDTNLTSDFHFNPLS